MLENSSVPEQEEILRGSDGILRLIDQLERVIKGKREFLEDLVTAWLAGGHVLLEDYPGLGKTTVAKALAALVGNGGSSRGSTTFRRIQFTPDLLPYDITGVEVFNPETKKFRFVPGPVFSQVVLADEINRAGPKVQSALLEVMAEHQVTVGGRSHPMDDLFFVIATQNPLEIEGTYLLPLAQMDRFLMRLSLGYPDLEAEMEILTDNPGERELPLLKPALGRDELLALRSVAAGIFCAPELLEGAARAAKLSREHPQIALGISPRGVLHLIQAARSRALLRGRNYIIDQDLLDLAEKVWGHRLRRREAARGKGMEARELVREGLKLSSTVPVRG